MPMKTRTFLPRRWPGVLMGLLVAAALALAVVFLVAPFFIDIDTITPQKRAKIEVSNIERALMMFKHDTGRYPTNAEGLQALIVKPADADGWDGPYLYPKGSLPDDPWGNPFRYSNSGPGVSIEILSLGADNAPGGEGEKADIRIIIKDE